MRCENCNYHKTLVDIINKAQDAIEHDEIADINNPSMTLTDANTLVRKYIVDEYADKFTAILPAVLSNRKLKYDPDGDIKVVFHGLITAIRFIRL